MKTSISLKALTGVLMVVLLIPALNSCGNKNRVIIPPVNETHDTEDEIAIVTLPEEPEEIWIEEEFLSPPPPPVPVIVEDLYIVEEDILYDEIIFSTSESIHQAMVPEPVNTEEYTSMTENGFLLTSRNPLSTFSIDVDAASYSNMRRFINMGKSLPRMRYVRRS